MIVNPDEFQAISLKNESKIKVYSNNCNGNVIIAYTVKVLVIEIDKDLTFDTHIAKLSSKTAAELNAISILNRHLDNSENSQFQSLV